MRPRTPCFGVPVAVLAVFLGGRIVAGELDEHTLEIAYTVPGGTHRVWLGKLADAGILLFASVGLMAVATYIFFTPFSFLQTLYGSIQGIAFYLVASMGLATLFRSEIAGALATVALLAFQRPYHALRRHPDSRFPVLESLGDRGHRPGTLAGPVPPEPNRHRADRRRRHCPDVLQG